MLFRACLIFAAVASASANPYKFINDRYQVDFLEFKNGTDFFAVERFVILPDGKVTGRAEFSRTRNFGRALRKQSEIKGEVTFVRRQGVLTTANIKARSRGARYKFTISNSLNLPDDVRGWGTIRVKGKKARVRIDNHVRLTPGLVEV